MKLELEKLFLNDGEIQDFSYEFSLGSTEINGVRPFVSPVSVKGRAESRAGAVDLDTCVSFDFSIPCDRCAERIDTHYDYGFHHVLISSQKENDSELYIAVKDRKLNLDELVREDILLELPSKFLCRPDCKGLCPKCGKNLNDGPCGCVIHPVDPRLEVLKQLID